ncbi:hypothetical protein LMG28688_01318 [Paraburkholderia caffeinitolerans]|uniref:DUF7673 domain-containing protein n=2 Tax=Paraburkholderia TaxID=1822464 RepID=A0A6J5FJM4_9BURK|nr:MULTISPECIES: hypothetical protein [Paraburkholderia]GGC65527.1 hypothetical protein GCM10011400_61940 [Paraburkholderia caffeinilytica]CAB3781779.1 hypothetical protein LMG28688_01318 [Paraburkholderia caffeinitolerans]CAB3802215.1 hypothetical protein LMG28690_05521 [Paraburkholderia caffeinilytica]
MNIAPRPKTHRITSDVPEHLLEAFQHTIAEFFANAHGGQTPAQRAAEIRAGDRDRGLDSLLQLVDMAEGDTEQAETVAEFLAGLYNGTDYRLDLTALRAPDDDLFEHCLAVLRLDHRPTGEVHGYFPGGERRRQQIITRWNLDKRPARAGAASWRTLSGQLCDVSGSTRLSRYDAGSGDRREPCTPAADRTRLFNWRLGAYSRDLIYLHRGAWRPREWHEGPLDM